MCAADRLHARFGKAEVLDLTFLNQLLDRAGDVFDRHVRGQRGVDRAGRSTSTLSRLSDPSTASLIAPAGCSSPAGPSFHGDRNRDSRSNPNFVAITTCVAEGSEGFAHEFFVRERTIHFGGVEEGNAAFHGCLQAERSSPAYLWVGRRKSSFPCSQDRSLRLPDRCCQVFVSSFFSQMMKEFTPDFRFVTRSFCSSCLETAEEGLEPWHSWVKFAKPATALHFMLFYPHEGNP